MAKKPPMPPEEPGVPGAPKPPPRPRKLLLPPEETAVPLLPAKKTLETLAEAAADCKACPLWKTGTQTVFGEGKRKSRVMFVGEQPGDKEDLAGKPFVGPAGALLDRCLEEAGIDRSLVYVTNTVKHFKWQALGKRRIHQKPNAKEIYACRPWLEAEIDVVKPDVIVALGATAAQALLGKAFKVTVSRGEFFPTRFSPNTTATIHPSSILRAPDDETRHRERERFIADLKKIRKRMDQLE